MSQEERLHQKPAFLGLVLGFPASRILGKEFLELRHAACGILLHSCCRLRCEDASLA